MIIFIIIPDKENMTFRQSVLLLSVLLCLNRLSLIVNLIKILSRHSPSRHWWSLVFIVQDIQGQELQLERLPARGVPVQCEAQQCYRDDQGRRHHSVWPIQFLLWRGRGATCLFLCPGGRPPLSGMSTSYFPPSSARVRLSVFPLLCLFTAGRTLPHWCVE